MEADVTIKLKASPSDAAIPTTTINTGAKGIGACVWFFFGWGGGDGVQLMIWRERKGGKDRHEAGTTINTGTNGTSACIWGAIGGRGMGREANRDAA